MRRVNSYSSTDRFYDYEPLSRRASNEQLYSSRSSYFNSSNPNRYDEYPRRWSDDFTYNNKFLPFEQSPVKKFSDRFSPRQSMTFDNYSTDYNRKYGNYRDLNHPRNKDYYDDYDYTQHGKDYYNEYGKPERRKYDYDQYQGEKVTE